MTERYSASRADSDIRRSMRSERKPRIPSWAALRAHWREDYAANGRGFWRPGFQAVALYRFGVWVDGHPNRFLRFPLRKLYKLLYLAVRNLYGIELPSMTRVGRRLHIGHQSGIVISGFCTIGDDCLIHQNVTIGSPRGGMQPEERPRLGDRVEIGAGAVVLGPVHIGHDTRIGANTVVRESVPPWSKVLPPVPEIRPRTSRPAEASRRPPPS